MQSSAFMQGRFFFFLELTIEHFVAIFIEVSMHGLVRTLCADIFYFILKERQKACLNSLIEKKKKYEQCYNPTMGVIKATSK
jgi:hypothetical protein